MGLDFDDDRLPSTRRAVRWLVAIIGMLGVVEALTPLIAGDDDVLAVRSVTELLLQAAALSLPWLLGAALMGYRPRLGTAMIVGAALVSVPRQVWLIWVIGSSLRGAGRPFYPTLGPRSALLAFVLLTLFLLYVSRPRRHWRQKATPISRRALVPIVMALLWTVGPITDPDPVTGQVYGGLLPTHFDTTVFDFPGPLVYLLLHAVPVLIAGALSVGVHRRLAGAAMMAWGGAVFLLLLGQFLTARVFHDASLLPIGGVTFLGLVSMMVIGQQWSTEGTRFADPGHVAESPGQRTETE